MATGRVRVLSPTPERKVESAILAARLNSLEGKAIGLLDNSKAMVDVFLARIEERLSADFRTGRFFKFRKTTPARGVPPDAMAQLTNCDAVIVGIAD